MEKTKEAALNDFLNANEDGTDSTDSTELEELTEKDSKKEILSQRDGIVERVDKIFVTQDGKQLLREQY